MLRRGIEFRRPAKTSPILERYLAAYRKEVPFVKDDIVMYKEIHKTVAFSQSDQIRVLVESSLSFSLTSSFIEVYPLFIDFSLPMGGNTFIRVFPRPIFVSSFSVNTCFDICFGSYNIYQICVLKSGN